MEYVMVPVPEEHVVDVMLHVARLVARTSVVPWTDLDVAELFDEVDEASRSVLSFAARSIVAGKDVSDEDAASALELNVREVRAIIRDINDIAQRSKHEPLVTLPEVTVVLRNGRTVQRRMFAMTEPVAQALRSHERTTLADEPGAPARAAE